MDHIFNTSVLLFPGINPQDTERIRQLTEVLSRKVVDLKSELEEQPKHQLTASYFSNVYKFLKEKAEAERDRMYYNMYHHLVEKGDHRPTENRVASILRQDPSYLSVLEKIIEFEFAYNQLDALHAALVTRARMLEQISNNIRQGLKLESEDDLS